MTDALLTFTADEVRHLLRNACAKADCAACWTIKTATTEEAYRKGVADLLAVNDDATLPDQGWPWPWETSYLTDRVYCFVDGRCKLFFGDEKRNATWPDMTERKNVTLGKRSGLMILTK